MSFVLHNIRKIYTLEGALAKSGKWILPEDLSPILDASMVITSQNKIAWVGRAADLPSKFRKLKKTNAQGQVVLPAFIDSHTHLVFAGDRSDEFEMRLAGKSYQEIAHAGGGITCSMQATRNASFAELFKLSLDRVENFLAQGVTTIEIKTGYGLDFESELKCLKVIDALKKKSRAKIMATFLAAHSLPPEFKGRHKEYVQTLSFDWLPKLKKYCDFVDIFIDEGYFTESDAEILFSECKKYKIKTRVHADELGLTGGTATAIKFQSLSADHLLRITDKEVASLSNSNVTATLLPTTAFFLKTDCAPARDLLDAGARVALATDFNPGTSPTQDISLVGILAALHMRMRTEEIIAALTINGAFALGLEKSRGALLPGYDASFIMTKGESLAEFFYHFGQRRKNIKVFSQGRFV